MRWLWGSGWKLQCRRCKERLRRDEAGTVGKERALLEYHSREGGLWMMTRERTALTGNQEESEMVVVWCAEREEESKEE